MKPQNLSEISIYCSCCCHKSDVQYNLRPLHSPRPPPRTCWHAPCCSSHSRLGSLCLEAAPRQHQCRRFLGCCLMDLQGSQGRLFHRVHCLCSWKVDFYLFLRMLFLLADIVLTNKKKCRCVILNHALLGNNLQCCSLTWRHCSWSRYPYGRCKAEHSPALNTYLWI